MPTYQYACTECGQQLEAFQSFSDAALTECPNCQGKLRKVFNSVGIVFKGSGFYRNDSRSGDVKAEKSKDAGAPAASSSGTDSTASKSDSSTSGSSSSSSSSSSDSGSSGSSSSGSGSSGGGSSSSGSGASSSGGTKAGAASS